MEPPDGGNNYTMVSSKFQVLPKSGDAQPRSVGEEDLDKMREETSKNIRRSADSRPRSFGGPNLKKLRKRTLKEYKEQKEWASHFRGPNPPPRRPSTPPTPEWDKPEPEYDKWGVLLSH